MKISSLLSDFRKWLDGEDAVSQAPEPQPQLSEWDEFFVKVAREVETVMKREMFTPPGGPTYLPGEYIIYLSKEDDLLWQGRKREGLEEGLRNGLSQRARELVGDKVLKTDRIALSLGVDGALNKGQVRVQAVWDDDSPRTEVTARKKKPAPAPAEPAAPSPEPAAEGERTIVRPRAPLFKVVHQHGADEPATFASHKTKIEIGRGSKDFPVDLKLEGDLTGTWVRDLEESWRAARAARKPHSRPPASISSCSPEPTPSRRCAACKRLLADSPFRFSCCHSEKPVPGAR